MLLAEGKSPLPPPPQSPCLGGGGAGRNAPEGQKLSAHGRMERSGMAPWVIKPTQKPSPYRVGCSKLLPDDGDSGECSFVRKSPAPRGGSSPSPGQRPGYQWVIILNALQGQKQGPPQSPCLGGRGHTLTDSLAFAPVGRRVANHIDTQGAIPLRSILPWAGGRLPL